MVDAKETLFAEAINSNLTDAKVSKEEAARLTQSMQNEQFQGLFLQYIDEISNPKHRAENEEYLAQLEEKNEVPQGKQVLHPSKGFVLRFKFTRKGSQNRNGHRKSSKKQGHHSKPVKLFLNIVHSEKMGQPVARDAPGGTMWQLPYSLSPLRKEFDNGKTLVPTLDCCFHPDTLVRGAQSVPFRDLIAKTAREGAMLQYAKMKDPIEIGSNYTLVKGTQYKDGEPSTMLIAAPSAVPVRGKADVNHREDKEETKREANGAILSEVEGINKCKADDAAFSNNVKPTSASLKRGFLLSTKASTSNDSTMVKDEEPIISTLLVAAKSTEIMSSGHEGDKGPIGLVIPHYEVTEKGDFDLADHTIDGLKRPSTRPKYLEYKISLPNIKSAKEIDLDVMEKSFVLSSSKYHLCVKLPYPIDEGTAKFDKSRSTLNVLLPVQRHDPTAPWVSVSIPDEECEEKESLVNIDEEKKELDDEGEEKDSLLDDSLVIVEKVKDTQCHSRWIDANASAAAPVMCKNHSTTVKSVPVLSKKRDETEKERKVSQEKEVQNDGKDDENEEDYVMIDSFQAEVEKKACITSTHFETTIMFELD